MKKFQTLAAALAMSLGGLAAGHAMAQDTTIVRDTPNGVVTKHVERSYDDMTGQVHRTVRVHRPDGTTVVRHITRNPDGSRVMRTRIVHHRVVPMRHVVVREYHRPATIVNRHVTVIHDDDAS
jgi:hypothetical protein